MGVAGVLKFNVGPGARHIPTMESEPTPAPTPEPTPAPTRQRRHVIMPSIPPLEHPFDAIQRAVDAIDTRSGRVAVMPTILEWEVRYYAESRAELQARVARRLLRFPCQ